VAVINFINGIFNKSFPKDSKLTYNWTENIKNSLEKTIAYTIITVNNTEKFHTEFQLLSELSDKVCYPERNAHQAKVYKADKMAV
jgi:hypothetical protein